MHEKAALGLLAMSMLKVSIASPNNDYSVSAQFTDARALPKVTFPTVLL